ncbi:MAG: N-6 DNA methylase, partial [Methanobacteriota archaeon]
MVDKETSKAKIRGLVEKYNLHTVKWHKISESDTKSKFLEPLLEHLGWDVKGDKFPDEVIKEERIQQRRADYTLRINGISKLIVEAKAIKEDLDKEAYAKQAIKYAYNKKVSWAALTDFEGLKIFYAEENSIKPFRNLQLWNIDVFDENFEDIWLLSKDAFISGELDKKAEREGRKKRNIPIDEQLFQDLNNWRELLSKDIARRYGTKYEDYEVDEIVQRIIDRLIFIRKTEDIGIEENQLMMLKRTSTKNIYKKLKDIFSYYNESYNSKLFGETEEDQHECDNIEISDDVILTIIHGLYYSPGRFVEYDFAAIDADVLGNIYEQYLSHILKKTPKSAKLKDGRTHKKEQGIYYTPTYIVDYIVRNTLGELLKDKKVKPGKIRVLDPACGSGSFLLKTFDFINEYYNKKEGRSHQTQLDESGIFTRKAQVLRNNIFGVDLDPKAVEIAQLNLLLKLAERKHRLPTLKENIKCGNSLVDDKTSDEKAFVWPEEYGDVMQ